MPASRQPSDPSRIFQPTWARIIFALALAIAGFLLPQEVPLEWYPLNKPGEDINYLEITCASDKNGEVHIFYDTGKGSNELDSIRWPISPTTQTYTYTFPLPDAPLNDLSLAPVANGGALTIRQMRIIDRRGTEMRRFTREMFSPIGNIAAITPLPDGWKIVSESNASTPGVHIKMDAPILATGINHRNFLRCLYSSSYLTLMLWILLLAVLFTFYRPHSWPDAGVHLGFMAALALMFSLVGNRGLIKNSVRYSRFTPPVVARGVTLEIDLRIDQPLGAQLFWDSGQGFNEADSLRRNYEPHQGLQTLRFSLPSGPLKALRFDPLDGEAKLVVRGLRIVDIVGRTLAILPLSALQPQHDIARCIIADDLLAIDTTPNHRDPFLMLAPAAVTIINQTLAVQIKP